MGLSPFMCQYLRESVAKHGISGDLMTFGRQDIVDVTGPVPDKEFFKHLGFASCASLDGNKFDGADIIHDLNEEAPHDEIYDCVLDSGTIEHVFSPPSVFRNIFHMLRQWGHVIHITPCNNYVDHGFYQVSPTLYADYYATNLWDVKAIRLWRHTQNANVEPWSFINYDAESFTRATGGLDNALYAVSCIAQKTSLSTCDKVPIQGAYRKQWR